MNKLNGVSLFSLLARFCDYCSFYLTIGAITLSLPYFYGPLFYSVLALITPLLWIPLEAFLLSKWATTPGKSLFGFSVTAPKGGRASYSQALLFSCFLTSHLKLVKKRRLSWRRKCIGVVTSSVFGLLVLSGNALALWSTGLEKNQLNGWVQYSSDEAGFSIAFPKNPESTFKELPIPNSNKTLSYQEITSQESKKVAYSISHLEMPGKWKWAGTSTLLKGVLNLIVEHSEGGILLEKEFKTHGNHRVLDYKMLVGKEEMRGRLVIVGGTLYKLTVVYPYDQEKDSQITSFLDSFEVS